MLAPPAATAEPPQHDVDVGEDDERGGQDGPVVEGHDQLVPLELPDLVGDGLHLKEGVAESEKVTWISQVAFKHIVTQYSGIQYFQDIGPKC